MSDGTTTWNYTYNADGLRTQRTNGTATYKYIYNGSSLVQMTVGNDTLYFTDATVTYNNTVYYYVKNIQGDIVAILDTDGDAVVQYTYDAWGNILTTTGELANTLGQINPLRYRGYVYDTETGLYYLQSRYYDPEIGRFLNADAFTSTGQGILGNNMFSYCLNNPINLLDAHGSASIWYYLLKYAYMGYIHSCVEAHIIKHYINVETEVWIRRDGQLVGRADLMQENSVWEIKHGGHDLLTALSRILSATEQAGSYLGGTAVRTGKDVTDLGDALRFKGTFTINAFAVTYQVTYITPSKGTVLYFVNAVDYNCEADYDFNVAIANRLPKPNFANPLNYAPNPVAIGANIMIAVCVFSAFYSVSKQGA